MGGLGALGGKNLLLEMKKKQEKRFSHLPTSPTDPAPPTKDPTTLAKPPVLDETSNDTPQPTAIVPPAKTSVSVLLFSN